MRVRTRPVSHTALVLGPSLAFHGLLFMGLHGGAHASVPKPSPLRVTVLAAQPQPAPPVLPPPPAPDPVAVAPTPAVLPRAPRRPALKQARTAELPAPATPSPASTAPSAAEAVDFTGVTLTSAGPGGWVSAVGNGQSGSGVIGAPGRAGSGRGVAGGVGTSDAGPQGPRVVGLGSLSRPPRAPNLDQALRSHYPRQAQQVGQAGQAAVRVRILADGRVERTVVLTASAPEFGRACQAMLEGSRWSAPLDAKGAPVATDVSYTCRFEVER
jgi:TonB family protein